MAVRAPAHRVPALLGLGVALSLVAPPSLSDLVSAVVVLAALGLTVSAARSLSGSRGWRLLTIGAVLIGFAPAITEVHRGIDDEVGALTLGDAVLVIGYCLFIAGVQAVLTSRTLALQSRSIFDSALTTLWLAYVTLIISTPQLSRSLSGFELAAALLYLPLTLTIVFLLLRLVFGTQSRSTSVWLLASAAAMTVVSEFGFLAVAAGNAGVRPIAVAAATVGIVLLAIAIRDPSAAEIEQPVTGLDQPLSVARSAYLILALVALAAAVVIDPRPPPFAVVILAAIGVATMGNLFVTIRERERVLAQEQRLRHGLGDVMRAERPATILELGGRAVDDLLNHKRHVETDFLTLAGGTWQVVPDGVAVRFANDSERAMLDKSIETGHIEREETPSELPGIRFATHLTVPLPGRTTHAKGLLVEASPVLTTMEIDQLRQIATSVDQALTSFDLHELTHKQRADKRFRTLVQDSNDVVCLIDPEPRTIKMVSPSLKRIIGLDEEEVAGDEVLGLAHPDDAGTIAGLISECLVADQSAPIDVRLRHKKGHYNWFSLMVRDQTFDAEISGIVLSFTDVQDRKMAELSLGFSEQRYRTMVLNSKDVFALLERDLTINYISPNVERVLGFRAADLIASNVSALLTPRSLAEIDRFMANTRGALKGDVLQLEVRTQAGGTKIVEVAVSDREDGQGTGYTVTMSDITERTLLEKSLREQALYDQLTGLANRPTLHAEIHQRLQRLTATEMLGVIHLDISDFKSINDSVGFEAGDDVLVEVATRLRASLRTADTLARVGGNEFAIATIVDDGDDMMGFARRVSAAFAEPFVVADRQQRLAVTLGVDVTGDRAVVAERILENASLAVSEAKRQSPDGVNLYEPAMRENAVARFELGADLESALDRGELSLVYQPILEMETRKVREVEALMRWTHPDRGPISPGVFIPLAEKSGLIVELGRWVMQTAATQLLAWQSELESASALSISVNVSALQLELEGEAARLGEIVTSSGLEPGRVTVELTESTFLEDATWIHDQLQVLRELGMGVAVDDFGTGASGLAHLRDIPFNIVKIDKSYVDALADSGGEAEQLVRGVIELAHRLGAETVAEGIETPDEFDLLRSLDCDLGQGFYLGRPMDPAQLEDWFQRGRLGIAPALIQQGPEPS